MLPLHHPMLLFVSLCWFTWGFLCRPCPLLAENGLLDPPAPHKGVVDQMSRVSRLVSFADSHRA